MILTRATGTIINSQWGSRSDGQLMKQLTIAVLCAGLARSVLADTVFDNSVNDIRTRFNPGTYEVGDQIVLAGRARYLTNFSFEYWGTNTVAAGNPLFSGLVQARVRFF